jgi:hypothetical protein
MTVCPTRHVHLSTLFIFLKYVIFYFIAYFLFVASIIISQAKRSQWGRKYLTGRPVIATTHIFEKLGCHFKEILFSDSLDS